MDHIKKFCFAVGSRVVALMCAVCALLSVCANCGKAQDVGERYKALAALAELSQTQAPGVPPVPRLSERILEVWNLRQPEVSASMLMLANTPMIKKGTLPPGFALSLVLESSYSIGMEWIVLNFEGLTTSGRSTVVGALGDAEGRESFLLLASLWHDHRYGRGGRSIYESGPYYRPRICDLAYNAFFALLESSLPGTKAPFPFIEDGTPYPERDAIISKMETWWEKHKGEVLKRAPEKLSNVPDVKDKFEKLIAKLQAEPLLKDEPPKQ